jgi:uncharacterized protein YbcI
VVTVALHDCLTRAERVLADSGHEDLVGRARDAIYEAIRPDAIAAVEEIVGSPVSAYLTDHVHEPDVAVLVFVLAAPPRAPRAL